ncbi:MAG: hypothetical protein KY463_11460 [Actinobacteria bacterium]|nr:hypothetical protein [Actinomycetota bacterium]
MADNQLPESASSTTPSAVPAAVDRVVSRIVVPPEQSMVALLGSGDQVLKAVERLVTSDVHVRGNEITITGTAADNALAVLLFEQLLADLKAIGANELRTGISWADWHTDGGQDWYAWLLPRLVGLGRATEILMLGEKVSADEAHAIGLASRVVADDVLRQGVQGISDLVTLPGVINLDFADVRTIMANAGNALLGIGMGTGESRAIDAANTAVSSPLLETSMEGAHSILLSITGGRDLSLWEINEAAKAVSEAAHPEANIIFGAMVDETLEDQVWVTVVATRYSGETARRRLEEPAGEPRVTRGARPSAGREDFRRPVEDYRHPRDRNYRAPAEREDYRPRAPEPEPEPEPEPAPGRRGGGLGVTELDVPEFMPRRF